MSLVESVPFREWGTRYDSLSTSPSPSTTASSLSRNPPTTTCTSAANSSLLPPRVVTPIEFRSQGEKPSNDASVFVGSLPTNVDHVELGARLKDHLSIYVDVNVVRIIRDRRGGVCAFAQCNDSATAARLLQIVRSLPPQSFMGRYLRFEPARSQRTLWISYRKPVEVIYDTDHGRPNPSLNPTSRFIGFDLPKVMRICRAPGSRRINILYNTQAFHPDGNTNISLSHSLQEQDAAESDLSGVGLVLSPLQFDSQTLRRIASSFGPLESFDLRQPEPTDDRPEYQTYPYPHNADRSESMDPGCWEIKWENRNDCLSALATLCSVPHLTVTWPNQQHALIPRRNGLFNRSHQVRDHEAFRHPGLPVQPRYGENDNTPNQIISSLGSPSPWKDSAGTAAAAVGPQPSSECLSPLNNDDLPITADGWTIIDAGSNTNLHVPPTFQDIPVSEQLQVSVRSHPCDDEVLRMGGVPSSQSSKRVEWSEVVSDSAAQPRDEVATLSPASPLHTPARGGNPQSPPPGSVTALSTPFVESLASPFTPRSPRLVHPHTSSSFNFYDTFAIPPAPQWSEARLRRSAGPCDENIDDNSRNVPDSTTIFVGGLEVHGRCTWDEQRLRRVFGQYGDITEVKLVRPAHRKSAFAFVTYRNNKSSSRAVLAEHDRIYDGRHIRVQLRDSAVHRVHRPKSNFKSGEIRPFSPRHQIGPRINSSLIDTIPRFQNGTGPTIPHVCEESVPTLPHSPDGVPSVQPDARGQVPENTCVPSIPSQVSSAMVSGVPPMAYPPPPPPTFYAPAPWFMHPYPYVPPPHIVPGYPPIHTPPVVSANEAGRPAPPHTMYQPIPHYSLYPLSLPPIPPNRQQHVELANLTERRAPLQPTGFIESEQGLIPVYAPEALGEYMANTNSHQSTAEPGGHSASHPPKAVLEARSRTMYAMYPQHQYHPTFVSDRMMPAPSQFPNALNMMPVGTGFNWYHETTNSEHLAQEVFRVAGPAAQRVEIHPGIPTVQSPRCQAYSERGFGVSRRRGQIDRSAFARISRANNHPGAYTTRRRGYFKHTGGTVSMSAVTDQTAETSQSDVASVADPVVRASTSSPAVFDLTPTSPTGGTQM